jgi:O-antigen/teichoic acid export membrane protein
MNLKKEENPSLSDRVIKNTSYNIVGRFWSIVVTIFLMPYIVSHIGLERFAVWSFVGTITGYFSLFDFGIGTSFIKYIAEFYANKEYEKINQVVNTGFFFYFVFFTLIFILGYYLINPLIGIFRIPEYLHGEAFFVFLIGIALFVVSNTFSPFSSLQLGLQRMDISNKIAIVISFFNIAGTIIVIEKGFGLTGLMINNAMLFCTTSIINVIVSFRILPELRFGPRFFDILMFKKMFGFGWNIQIARISSFVTSQTDKILITVFLSLGLVTFYQLGGSVVYYAIMLPGLLVSALMPAFSEIEARGERTKLVESYLRSSQYVAFLTIPFFIFIFFAADHIMFAWMGTGYEKSVLIIRILSAAWLVNTIAQVAASTCVAIGRPNLMAAGSVIIVVCNIVFGIFFVKLWGFYGIAWGTLLAVNAGTLYFMVRLHKVMSVPIAKFVLATVPFLPVSICAAICMYATDLLLNLYSVQMHRIQAFLMLGVQAAFFCFFYLIGVHYARLFKRDEVEFLESKFTFFRWLVKHLSRKYAT